MAENQENIELKKLTYIYLKMPSQGCHCAFIGFADFVLKMIIKLQTIHQVFWL